MLYEILIVATAALWALGVQLLVGRLLLSIALVVINAAAPGRRRRFVGWLAASAALRSHVYAALALLVAAGLSAHLLPGARLSVAPHLSIHAAWWVVPAAFSSSGALLLLVAGGRELHGRRRHARRLTRRGGLLLAGGGALCAALAAFDGLFVLAGAAALAAAVGLLAAGSRKALPSGRFAAALWASAISIAAWQG